MPTFNTKVVKYNNDLQGTVIIDGKEYSFDNLVKDEQDEILRKCEEITSQKFKFSDVATKMIDKFIEGFATAAGTSAWVFTKANMLNLIQYIF